MSTYFDEFEFTPNNEAYPETGATNPHEVFSGQSSKLSSTDRAAYGDFKSDVADRDDYFADTPVMKPVSHTDMVKAPLGIVDFASMLDSTSPPDDLLTPKYLTMSDDDPKKSLNQEELKHIFKKMVKFENVCGASLRNGKASLNSRLYPIGTGLAILSVEGRLRFMKIDLDTAFPLEFVCGYSDKLELPVLICRINHGKYSPGRFFIPDFLTAKFLVFDEKKNMKQISCNFSYFANVNELDTPSRATETPDCTASMAFLNAFGSMLLHYNWERGSRA